jgi:ABC-type Fe3+ transport system substrate-binding protein
VNRKAVLAAGAAGLLVAGLAAGWLLRDTGSGCSGAPLTLYVTAQPEIGPAVREVAARFDVQDHAVRGRCVRVAVTDRESAGMASDLAAGRPTPDVWIPDSWVWITAARQTRAGTARVPQWADPVASTPVVLAVTTAVAAELQAAKTPPTWKLLTGPDFTARTPDPSTTGPAALALAALRQTAPTDVAPFVRRMYGHTAPSATAFADFLTLPRDQRALVVATEQQVATYNAAHQPNPASPLVPAEGTFLLTYPYAVTAQDPLREQAAEAFKAALQSRPAQDILTAHDFRTPTGTATEDLAQSLNVATAAPRQLPLTPALYEAALKSWRT